MNTSWIAALALACTSIAATAAAQGAIAIPALLPEADAYGVMLAGLGILTLLGRRRVLSLPSPRLQHLMQQSPPAQSER